MSSKQNAELKKELVEWGRWSRFASVMGSVARGNSLVPNITDDRALEIDQVVGRIRMMEKSSGATLYQGRNKARTPYVYHVVMNYFIEGKTVLELAKDYRMDRKKVDRILLFGITQIAIGLGQNAANDDKY